MAVRHLLGGGAAHCRCQDLQSALLQSSVPPGVYSTRSRFSCQARLCHTTTPPSAHLAAHSNQDCLQKWASKNEKASGPVRGSTAKPTCPNCRASLPTACCKVCALHVWANDAGKAHHQRDYYDDGGERTECAARFVALLASGDEIIFPMKESLTDFPMLHTALLPHVRDYRTVVRLMYVYILCSSVVLLVFTHARAESPPHAPGHRPLPLVLRCTTLCSQTCCRLALSDWARARLSWQTMRFGAKPLCW